MTPDGKFFIAMWGIVAAMFFTLVVSITIYSLHEELYDHERQLEAADHIAAAIKKGVDPIEARCAYYWENKAVCVAATATRK